MLLTTLGTCGLLALVSTPSIEARALVRETWWMVVLRPRLCGVGGVCASEASREPILLQGHFDTLVLLETVLCDLSRWCVWALVNGITGHINFRPNVEKDNRLADEWIRGVDMAGWVHVWRVHWVDVVLSVFSIMNGAVLVWCVR